MPETREEMNEAQQSAFQHINDNWPVAHWVIREDKTILVTCDDGGEATIQEDGSWEWT